MAEALPELGAGLGQKRKRSNRAFSSRQALGWRVGEAGREPTAKKR